MRYSYDLMLNIIDLPSLGHRRQVPPRTARQEELLSCHCEVRVISHRYWRCICNHQADTPFLFCYPPQLIWSARIIPTFLWRKPSASRLNAKLKEGVGSFPKWGGNGKKVAIVCEKTSKKYPFRTLSPLFPFFLRNLAPSET